MINRVKPQPSDDPFKRGKTGKVGRAGDNNHRVEKASESDPEKRKRRKFKQHLEENNPKMPDKKPSPYESQFYDKGPAEAVDVDKKLPEHKEEEFLAELPKEDKAFKEFEKKVIDEKKKPAKLGEDFEPSPKFSASKRAKEVKSTQPLKAPEEEKPEDKEAEGKKDGPPVIQAAPIAIPPEIIQQASEITNDLKVHLNAEISPIFEQMIGRILVMSAKEGIIQTEITLNNPGMENSVFYGAKITLEKYSTAPDSFNIRLTGTPEAVTVFNGNINILMDAFHRGNFNFRVGRIEASYSAERPLIRRKEKSGDSGDSSDVGGGPLEK